MEKDRLRLRLTLDVVYDADSDIYGTNDPAVAARMDEGQAVETLEGLITDAPDALDIKIVAEGNALAA